MSSTTSAAAAAAAMRIAVSLNEKDIIKMICEFLNNRDLYISMLDLERETGVINGAYSDDILFLRQLILDGQWDDVLEFIQPLKTIDTFNSKQFHYLIMKCQYLELLCLKCEAANNADNQLSVDQLVDYLNEIRNYCPNEEDYKKLCLLLTSARLQDHSEYRNWNPSNGRVQCFKEIYPLISKFLQVEKPSTQISHNDRLFQLIIKGLLYESCVEFCQARATSSQENYNLNDPSVLLMQSQLSETDASLLSWLHALPIDTFSCPFEEKSLKINLDRFIKPNLEATWADVILTTPIKPKQFPYNAVPSGRSRNTELMSRSLAPQYEGLSFGLSRSLIFNGFSENGGTASPVGNSNGNVTNGKKNANVNDISRSIALFSLNDKLSSSYASSPAPVEQQAPKARTVDAFIQSPKVSHQSPRSHLNGIKEEDHTASTAAAHRSAAPPPPVKHSIETIATTTPLVSPNKPNKSSKNDENNNINGGAKEKSPQTSMLENVSMHDSTLFREYQKNKAQILQQLEEQDKKREEFVKQLRMPTNTSTVVKQSLNSEKQQQSSPQPASSSKPIAATQPHRVRPINEATKFDSLEDITRAPTFVSVSVLEDQQAIRAVDIHPSGKYYVVGSNSKYLRVCQYPELRNIKPNHQCKPASVVYKKGKHHYGSIYCSAWNYSGSLIATGSNDKTIKVIKFTPDLSEPADSEIELSFHNGTVRDLIFMQQEQNNILVSGGAGDCKLYVTDCATQQPIRVYAGHEAHIYSLCTWATTSTVFVSGSQDKTCKFWDLRSPEAIQTINCNPISTTQGSPVAGVAVDPSGQLLASGHEDSACVLFDIRGSRIVQIFKPHTSDIRSVRFSNNAYYLLTASYDNKVIVTDLHGDLTKPLNWTVVAQHNDKIIQAKWHPTEMSFITTSADRTAVVWSLPSNDTFI